MNDFSCLTDDVVGRLATVGMGEFFEKGVDADQKLIKTDCMTKQEFRKHYRQQRIAANGGSGERMGKIMRGELVSNFNNAHIWELRNFIACEIEPIVRVRQLAYITG
jgi:hypothetical protein